MKEKQMNMYAKAVAAAGRKYANCFEYSIEDATSEMWVKACEVSNDLSEAGLPPMTDLAMRRTLRNHALDSGEKLAADKRALYGIVYAQKENATGATNADDIFQDNFSITVEQNVSQTLSVQLLFKLYNNEESATNRQIIRALLSDMDQCEIAEKLKISPSKVSRSIKRIRQKFLDVYGYNPLAS